MTVLQYCFWAAVFLLVYTYAGYPVIVCALSRWRARNVRKDSCEPFVSILIAAHNEAADIRQTLENKLSLDYPPDKLEIIVVSDASDDGTDEIVGEYASRRPLQIKLLRQSKRQGKTVALNTAVSTARGEILVFADANSIYEEDALRKLLRNFNDPTVGYVTGKMIYVSNDTVIGDGCTAFMKYENSIRSCETRFGSIVGVDGGIDAVRKHLYRTMRADQLPDFILPLSVVERGYRAVYEPEAVLRERVLTTAGEEYAMRVRVGLRALWALLDMKHLLNPLRYGAYSWQLLSHKLLRYMAFAPLVCVFLLNILLSTQGLFYGLLFVTQIVLYVLASVSSWGWTHSKISPFLGLPRYFVLINLACAHAFWRFLKGQKQTIWNPRTG